MTFVIGIAGLLQLLAGVLVYMVAKSAIHEILGALSFGMGVLSLALTVVIVKLDDIRKAGEAAALSAQRSQFLQSKIAEAFDRIAKDESVTKNASEGPQPYDWGAGWSTSSR